MSTDYIPICFCFDFNFLPYACVATNSLRLNSTSPLKIYWVIPKKEASLILNVKTAIEEEFNTKIHLKIADESVFDNWIITAHFSTANYFRLLIPYIIEEDKVIYLDSDTIVKNDLLELYSNDIEEFYFGGVPDIEAGEKVQIPFTEGDTYINTGVLLINSEKLRGADFLNSSIEIYRKYSSMITWADQDIINKFASDQKFLVDPKWNRIVNPNFISKTKFNDLMYQSNTAISHFTGPIKPWLKWCNPAVQEYWWQYAKDIKSIEVPVQEITTPAQAHLLALSLDLNEEFKEASALKEQIITYLVEHIKQAS